MSDIADVVTPNCVMLCNESFASMNEREGSEIARQIVRAPLERGIKVFFVTHMCDLAGVEVIGVQAITPGAEIRYEVPGVQLNQDGSTTYFVTVTNVGSVAAQYHFRGAPTC